MSGVLRVSRTRLPALLVFLLGLIGPVNSQHVTYKQYLKAGEDAFHHKDYFNAFRFYRGALAFNERDSLILQKVAESAMFSWRNDTARILFERLLSCHYDSCDSNRLRAHYHLGLVYQRMGWDSLALNTLQKALKFCPNSLFSEQINQLMKAINWAKDQRVMQDQLIIDSVSVARKDSSTTEHALAPVYLDQETLLFSRQYFCSTCHDDFIHQVGEIGIADSSLPRRFREELTGENSDSMIGFLTFNDDKSRIYYAECFARNTLDQQCRIVTRKLEGNILGPREIVLDFDQNDSITYTHPHYIAGNGLYLVSNRPGGNGGKDIWFGWLDSTNKLDTATLTKLEINSTANEVSPFFDRKTRSLYFSSDRLDDGKSYGGMDIYRASGSDNGIKFSNLEILSKPINSSKNDIFYVVKGDTSWFSSNRLDPYNQDQISDACCYDLFTAIDSTAKPTEDDSLCLVYFYPAIRDYCTSDSIDINSVTVRLYRIFEKERFDSIQCEIKLDSTYLGKRFPVERGDFYFLKAEKPGYLADTLPVTVGSEDFKPSNRGDDCRQSCDLFLRRTYSNLAVVTRYTCLGEDSSMALEGCTVFLTDDQGQVICIEGKSHDTFHFRIHEERTYILEIKHPDFTTQRLVIPIGYQQRDSCDQTVIVIMNQEISLYFENDVPLATGRAESLSYQTYTETWSGAGAQKGYASKEKENEYKANYARDTLAVRTFFDQVRSEIFSFEALKLWLIEKFNRDPLTKVTLYLEGRASPLADDHYNMALSQRRINSVVRDIQQDPRLSRFNQQISFKEVPGPRGEELSRTLLISDDGSDPEQSIYNPKAAEQRRITIRILPELCNKENN